MLLALGLSLKLGVFPAHWWFVTIIISIEKWTMLILLTVQKVLPILLVSYIGSLRILVLGLFSLVIAIVRRFIQQRFAKIIAVSSLYTFRWIVISILFFNWLWVRYFIIYCVSLMWVVIVFVENSNKWSISSFKIKGVLHIGLALTIILNLIGIPPLGIFFLKIFILEKLLTLRTVLTLVVLINYIWIIYIYITLIFTELISSSTSRTNYVNFYPSVRRTLVYFILVRTITIWLL